MLWFLPLYSPDGSTVLAAMKGLPGVERSFGFLDATDIRIVATARESEGLTFATHLDARPFLYDPRD